jgi:hypothetical protein
LRGRHHRITGERTGSIEAERDRQRTGIMPQVPGAPTDVRRGEIPPPGGDFYARAMPGMRSHHRQHEAKEDKKKEQQCWITIATSSYNHQKANGRTEWIE